MRTHYYHGAPSERCRRSCGLATMEKKKKNSCLKRRKPKAPRGLHGPPDYIILCLWLQSKKSEEEKNTEAYMCRGHGQTAVLVFSLLSFLKQEKSKKQKQYGSLLSASVFTVSSTQACWSLVPSDILWSRVFDDRDSETISISVEGSDWRQSVVLPRCFSLFFF